MTILRAQQNQFQSLGKEEQDWFVPGLEQQRHNIRFYDNKLPRQPGCAEEKII